MIESNPMMTGGQEHRVKVNGQTVILTIGNLPLTRTMNKLITLGNDLQDKHLAVEEKLLDLCKPEEDELAELEASVQAKNNTILSASELYAAKREMARIALLEKIIEQKPTKYKIEQSLPLVQQGFKGLLTILCPDSTITDEIIDELCFDDIAKIAEKSYKANRLDLIPKKLIPQSLKDMALKLVSGAM